MLGIKKRGITTLFLLSTISTWSFAYADAVPLQTLEPESFWLWNLLGRLHPLMVHFPVTLLLIAAILELFTLKDFNSKLRPGITVMVIIGALAAGVSAFLGILLEAGGEYSEQTLQLHKWAGILTAGLGVFILLFLHLVIKRNNLNFLKPYRGALFFTAIGVSIAGHFGASITHGDDYLTGALPGRNKRKIDSLENLTSTPFVKVSGILDRKNVRELNKRVKTILANNCYDCHSSKKKKGRLRLDEKQFIFLGGKSGKIIVSGNPAKSEIVRRISLPHNHDDIMPSKGRKLSKDEIEVISYWIEKGAPWFEENEVAGEKLVANPPVPNTVQKINIVRLSLPEERELNLKVRTIFAHNCYKCHSSEKVKGELRLDKKRFVFKGGESGPIFVPGKPLESELYRRINLPHNDKDVMPSKGEKLARADIGIIKFWIEKGGPWPDGADKKNIFRVAKLQPRNPRLPAGGQNLDNPVDIWTNEYFKNNKISWPKTVDDRTYLRRVYLDIIGLLPKPDELDEFIKDTRTDKKALWVKKLLNRDDDYAMHWLTFWNDALRNDYTGTGYIDGGRSDITNWLYNSIKSNKPYHQFVSELISPKNESKGFIEGIKWRGVVNASQRPEMQAAQNVSQVFLGLNLKCASCHNSFISDWKLEDSYAFANIFADTTLEITRCEKPTGKYTDARMLWKELGMIESTATKQIKRQQLAENITKPINGRLYRTIVNRVWAQIMGRGLIEPVDVMDNEPWNQDLLDWMAYNFQKNNSDIKELIYLIATSKTYQLPSVGIKDANKITSQDFKFKGMLRKRMSAEQFSDAVSSVIGSMFNDNEVKFNPVSKEGFKSTNNLFPRASLVANNGFLTALGRPNRETVSTGRESQANLLQALELTNGIRFNTVLRTGAEKWKERYQDGDLLIREIYRNALGRDPKAKEFTVAQRLLGKRPATEDIQDFFWAIVLLPEFQIIY